MLRGPAYSRPFPYRRENEQGPRRSSRRRIAPHGERRPDTATEEVALAPARARTESEGGAALPPARSPPLQPEDRPCLPSQGSLPATLGLHFARLGRQVPRRVVSADNALPHRAHEEDRPLPAPASGAAKVTMRKSYGFRTYRVL